MFQKLAVLVNGVPTEALINFAMITHVVKDPIDEHAVIYLVGGNSVKLEMTVAELEDRFFSGPGNIVVPR